MADIAVSIGINADKAALKAAVTQAITDLDYIIANIDAATTAQVKTAIKTLARQNKQIIKRLAQVEHG